MAVSTLRKIFAEMSYVPFSEVKASIPGIPDSMINTKVQVFSAEDTKRWMHGIDAVAKMLTENKEKE